MLPKRFFNFPLLIICASNLSIATPGRHPSRERSCVPFFAMRIRKGHRTLPLAPADSSFLHERSPVKDGALERPVAGIIGGRRYQERAKDTSMERTKCLESDLEKSRNSADDNVNAQCSLMLRGTGVIDAAVKKVAQIPSEEKSLFAGHKPLDKPQTISSTASVIETRDQLDILEQSLRHVCSRAGIFGLSARDGVAQIIEQGLPGLNEGDARLIEQVTKSFRNSSKFVESVELGRYFLQDSPASEVNKSLIVGASEISHEETVSSSEMVEVAKQLQSLQKSHNSFSLGSGVAELSEVPSVHASNQKAVNISQEFVKQSQSGRDFKDVTEMDQKASSNARFRSQKVMEMDPNVTQCKRDDGKGWRCSRLAEEGYTMCNHHRKRSISQGQCRRTKGRFDSEPTVSDQSPPCSTFVSNSRVIPDGVIAASSWSPFLDDELAHDEHRPFLKAKSMKSLLSKRPKKFSHIRKAV